MPLPRSVATLPLAAWLLCVALIASPAGAQQRGPIPLRALEAGVTTTLALPDLYLADDYAGVRPAGPAPIGAHYDPRTARLDVAPDADAEGLYVLHLVDGADTLDLVLDVEQMPEATFVYGPDAGAEDVRLFGAFNDWSRTNTPLRRDGDGRWRRTLRLPAGRYEYRLLVDGEEILDPANPDSVPNPFGAHNSLLTVAPSRVETAYLHVLGHAPGAARIDLLYDGPGAMHADAVFAMLDDRRLPASALALRGDTLGVVLPAAAREGAHVLRVGASVDGLASPLQTFRLFDGRPAGAAGTPSTWSDVVLYSLMIDRFANGHAGNDAPVAGAGVHPKLNWHGGDLAGLRGRVEGGYFDSLGVDVLWLSPVYRNPAGAFREFPEPHRLHTGYHGYWPVDSESVDPRFGDMRELRALVDAAHTRGMRVMLDFVANHVHAEHPAAQAHPDWFTDLELPDGRANIRLWDEQRLTTWFDTFLPTIDYERSDSALAWMTANAAWWLEQTGADAFRHDAVKHVPNRFWREATRRVAAVERARGRPVYQIGETYGSYDLVGSYVGPGQLDAQFNFNLFDAAQQTFLDPGASFAALDAALARTHDAYGMHHRMGNLMDNHDKVRFAAYADGDVPFGQAADAVEIGFAHPPAVDDPATYDRVALYAAYLLTVPGVPTIYQGDEIGMTGAADPDNRRMMRFGEAVAPAEAGLFGRYRALLHARRAHPALRYGDFVPLHVEADLYAYMRSDLNERVLVVLNKGASARRLEVVLPFDDGGRYGDVVGSGGLEQAGRRLVVDVPAVGYRILAAPLPPVE